MTTHIDSTSPPLRRIFLFSSFFFLLLILFLSYSIIKKSKRLSTWSKLIRSNQSDPYQIDINPQSPIPNPNPPPPRINPPPSEANSNPQKKGKHHKRNNTYILTWKKSTKGGGGIRWTERTPGEHIRALDARNENEMNRATEVIYVYIRARWDEWRGCSGLAGLGGEWGEVDGWMGGWTTSWVEESG